MVNTSEVPGSCLQFMGVAESVRSSARSEVVSKLSLIGFIVLSGFNSITSRSFIGLRDGFNVTLNYPHGRFQSSGRPTLRAERRRDRKFVQEATLGCLLYVEVMSVHVSSFSL